MKQIIKTILLASITIFIMISLITFPAESLQASVKGLHIWFEIVFPSLLPFFITAELLMAFGVVKFIGILCEPIMRPLFNVPGVGSFAWAMGMASGYPSGAKMSVRLREEKQLTQIEAERLLSFTNSASPLFIFGAISVGFFHDAKLGVLIAAAHYLGNALVGITMRFYGRSEEVNSNKKKKRGVSIRRAFKEMHHTRLSDQRLFGEILGDAILSSFKTLVMVGGFIILFSVFTTLLSLIGISTFFALAFQFGLEVLSLPAVLALPLLSGLFEITIGAQMISLADTDTLLAKVIIVSFILGFNGFSVQAQVSSIIAKTDIRFFPYFISRLLHAIFASILTVILYKPLYLDRSISDVSDIPIVENNLQENFWVSVLYMLKYVGPLITIFSIGIAITIIIKRSKRLH